MSDDPGEHCRCHHGDLCLGQTILDSGALWPSAADAGGLALNHCCWPGWITQRDSHAAKVCEEKTAKRKQSSRRRSSKWMAIKASKKKVVQGFCASCSALFRVIWLIKHATQRETEMWTLLSSPSWFITFPIPPTSLRLQALTLPWRYSREPGLCSAHNFKVHAPLLFFLSTYSIPLFLYLYSLSSLRCPINIFPLFCFFSLSRCRPLSLSTSPLSCSFPPFFFLTLHLSSSESHQPKDIKGMSPPLVAVIHPGGRVGFMPRPGTLRGGSRATWKHTALAPRERGKSKSPNKELCHTR